MRSEGIGRNTPVPHTIGVDSSTPDQKGHEDRESGVQKPPENAPEHTPGGGQDSEDARDIAQSGGPLC